MNAVVRLRQMGYTVTVDGADLVLVHEGPGEPDQALVEPLLVELRRQKPEVMASVACSTDTTATDVPVMYRSEAEWEAWWQLVDKERALAQAAPWNPEPAFEPGWSHLDEAPESPIPANDNTRSEPLEQPSPTPKPVWDEVIVNFADWPGFKAKHGLRVVGCVWPQSESRPQVIVEEFKGEMK